jgi:hypothetical protein
MEVDGMLAMVAMVAWLGVPVETFVRDHATGLDPKVGASTRRLHYYRAPM